MACNGQPYAQAADDPGGLSGVNDFEAHLSQLRGLTRLGVRRKLSSLKCAEPPGEAFQSYGFASEEDRLNGALMATVWEWPSWFSDAVRWLLSNGHVDDVCEVVERLSGGSKRETLGVARLAELPDIDLAKLMIHAGELNDALHLMEPRSGRRDGNPWNEVWVRWHWFSGDLPSTVDAFFKHFRLYAAPWTVRMMFARACLRLGLPNAPVAVGSFLFDPDGNDSDSRAMMVEFKQDLNACPGIVIRWWCKMMVQSARRKAD